VRERERERERESFTRNNLHNGLRLASASGVKRWEEGSRRRGRGGRKEDETRGADSRRGGGGLVGQTVVFIVTGHVNACMAVCLRVMGIVVVRACSCM